MFPCRCFPFCEGCWEFAPTTRPTPSRQRNQLYNIPLADTSVFREIRTRNSITYPTCKTADDTRMKIAYYPSNLTAATLFLGLTTTVPANLSCQPCFLESNITQNKPSPNGNIDKKYATYLIKHCAIEGFVPVFASTILDWIAILPGVACFHSQNEIVTNVGNT